LTILKETELGDISISDIMFAQVISECFKSEICSGRVFPATKKGRQIGNDQKYSISEFAGHIETEKSFDGESVDLAFSVIVKFGTSIRSLTDALGDDIANQLEKKLGQKPRQIVIRITGVKSRQIARRNLEVIKRYAAH